MRKSAKRACSINDCPRPFYGRGYCQKHYDQKRNAGALPPLWKQYDDPEQGFLARVAWSGECLEWTGSLQRGYGSVYVHGRAVPAHRYAWEREKGSIPVGMFVDHICHNRACVNLEHLRLATLKENARNRVGAQVTSTTGIRNVELLPSGNYRVRVVKNQKRRSYGVFSSLGEAVEVAAAARKELFGEFAGKG